MPDEDASSAASTERTSVRDGAVSALMEDLARAPERELGSAWPQHLHPGLEIGRFELVREIGRGGFGVVWEARDRQLGRSVAFKAVRAGPQPTLRESRLLEEAEIAARFSHPNIVTLHDVGRAPYGPYLVLELLRGASLAERLRRGPLPAREALRVAVEISRGVGHAHVRGVVHRDLKPGNVFVCDDGQVKVLDFGLAAVFGRDGVRGGTPAYMAPERWSGAAGDERSDVYSLGVVLFQMFSGRLPFGEGGGGASPPRPVPLELPVAGVGELIARMLDPIAERRPRNAVEVHDALVAIERAADRDVRVARRTDSVEPRAVAHYVRGREYLQQTRKASLLFAVDMFSRAVQLDPGFAIAHAALAEALALLHMYYPPDPERLAAAEASSTRALGLSPDLAEAHAARGFVLFHLGRAGEAEQSFRRALDLDPGLFEAYFYYARACFQSGRAADAARLFAEANRVREDYHAAFLAAQAIQATGDDAAAREAYRDALPVLERYMDLNPDDAKAATMRAQALFRVGRRDDGARWAQQALVLDPRDPSVRYNVACVYAVSGATEEAIRELVAVVGAGFANKAWIEKDPDLASIRDDARYRELMARI